MDNKENEREERGITENYKISDGWRYLIEDCKAIISQRVKNFRMELIYAYAEIGERIVNDDIYQKYGKGNNEFLSSLFESVEIGKTNGYAAIHFYESYFMGKVEDVFTGMETIMSNNFIEEGDNISWNKIKTKYLTTSKEYKPEVESYIECPKCGWKWTP